MARRRKSYGRKRSSRRYNSGSRKRRSGGMQRVVLEIRHQPASVGSGVVATGNPAQPFLAGPAPAQPGKGKF